MFNKHALWGIANDGMGAIITTTKVIMDFICAHLHPLSKYRQTDQSVLRLWKAINLCALRVSERERVEKERERREREREEKERA